MNNNDAYNLAIAFVEFKNAYVKLAKETAKHEDLDISSLYPFYLLDFEENTAAVQQWCNAYYSAIMKQLPERITNPSCVDCTFRNAGIDATGLCKGAKEKQCMQHPTILFSRSTVLPFLVLHGYTVSDTMTDEDLQVLYFKAIGGEENG